MVELFVAYCSLGTTVSTFETQLWSPIPAILSVNQINNNYSMKKELPVSKKTGVFPIGAMSTVALASFMDSFCYQIIVPNLPFAVKRWFPSVGSF